MTDETMQPAELVSIEDIAISSTTTLDDLAGRINAKHDMVIEALHSALGALHSALGYAINAGELLIEAKHRLKHGEWLPWLADNCSIPARTVSRYMALARVRARFCDENGHVRPISVRAALDMLHHPEDKTISPEVRDATPPTYTISPEVRTTTIEMEVPSYDTHPRHNSTNEPRPLAQVLDMLRHPEEATAATPASYETERLAAALDYATRMITDNREKAERGGQRFFSGTLRLARAMKEARDEFQSDRDFRRWLKKRGLDRGNDYAILLKLAEYPVDAMRPVIERLHSFERILEELQPEPPEGQS